MMTMYGMKSCPLIRSNVAMLNAHPIVGADAQKQKLFNRELRLRPYITSRIPARRNPLTYRKKNGLGLSSSRTRAATNPEMAIITTQRLDNLYLALLPEGPYFLFTNTRCRADFKQKLPSCLIVLSNLVFQLFDCPPLPLI